MLSAPIKSAKRISSIFSLGSHKDHSSDTSSPTSSPRIPKNSPDHVPSDKFHHRHRQSSSRTTHSGSSPSVSDAHESRPGTLASIDPLDLESPLPPPPSLLEVNQDLADTAASSPDGRPQSRGRSRSGSGGGGRSTSSAGLSVNDAPRPRTPSKRRSWIPGRTRSDSVDLKAVQTPNAWIAGLDQKVVYDLEPLAKGEQVRGQWAYYVSRNCLASL